MPLWKVIGPGEYIGEEARGIVGAPTRDAAAKIVRSEGCMAILIEEAPRVSSEVLLGREANLHEHIRFFLMELRKHTSLSEEELLLLRAGFRRTLPEEVWDEFDRRCEELESQWEGFQKPEGFTPAEGGSGEPTPDDPIEGDATTEPPK
ncbi:hypothetical protein HY625_00615 [Candidatus Uhrbacteria bacterium]|nr:hypothetical protein [Candidatus Uhrbacteria bacterium]